MAKANSTAGTVPQPMRALGYARVSTEQQGEDGLGMAAQVTAIETACALRAWTLVDLEHDVASGKSTNGRHGLQRALERIEAGEADALVVTKLDRLARSVWDGADMLRRAGKKGWALVVTELGLDTSTAMGKFGAHILLAAAELERDMVSERTKDARAEAIRQGKPVGGRPKGSFNIPAPVRERIRALRDQGASYRAIAATLDQEGHRPPRAKDGRWPLETIRKVVLS